MRQYYIAVPVSLIENMCKALSEYELTDGDWKACFDKIHDACVDIDAFCRDKLNVEALEQEPCEDAISRQAVLDEMYERKADGDAITVGFIKNLQPVTPQYTDAEIQKMQDLEFAEIQKAYEIGKAEGSEVLDKIRVEIDEQYDRVHPYNISCAEGLEMALDIIDKYKASPIGEEVE